MKAISAALVIYAGTNMLTTAWALGSESSVVLGFAGCLLMLIGIVGWWWAMGLEEGGTQSSASDRMSK